MRTHKNAQTQREMQMIKMQMRRKNIVFISNSIDFVTIIRSSNRDARTIERTKEKRFITTPYVWYRLSDLQKRTRACSSFPKMQIIPRLGRLAVSRRNKLRRMRRARGDDIQIREARRENDKNIHMTRTLHTSRVIGWYSDIGELSFAFILHRAKGHFARESQTTPRLYYPDIRYYVA